MKFVQYGTNGEDTLNGGTDADTLVGGEGNDTYIVNNAGDVVLENAGEGTDTVLSSVTYSIDTLLNEPPSAGATITVDGTPISIVGAGTDKSEIENLTLTGTANINGTGNALDNVLIGNVGKNSLTGGGGNDTLDGGLGADTLVGGIGDDTYMVDNAADVVTELAPGNIQQGIDVVNTTLQTYTLATNVENLNMLGVFTPSSTGIGNALGNVIQGSAGNNLLKGMDGNDSLLGGDGNDTLEGDAGVDTLAGGDGDDTYIITTATDATDVIQEDVNKGNDTIQANFTYTLNVANVENVTLTGTGNLNATGNSGNNILIGTSGNNELDGNGGNDTMRGGAGNDLYHVSEAGDVVDETSTGSSGTDGVISKLSDYTLTTNVEVLLMHTDAGDAIGRGNASNNVIFGNKGDNYLYGMTGNDLLFGDDPNLFLANNDGNDTLDGGDGNDTMDGGAGNDTYYVNSTGDVVSEATILPQLNLLGHASGFTLLPNTDMGGIDTVISSLDKYTLGANIENLTLIGNAFQGVGNTLDNHIIGNGLSNFLDGGTGNDTLEGGAGNDTYVSSDAGDRFVETVGNGTADELQTSVININDGIAYWDAVAAQNIEIIRLKGNQQFFAKGGSIGNTFYTSGYINGNAMFGGDGDDTYYLSVTADQVFENINEGDDTIVRGFETANSLSTNVENLTLTGTAKTGKGNDLDNTIRGNDSANSLLGMDGLDAMVGNGGNDTLDGGTGGDFMAGGTGNDLYFVDDASDVVFENTFEGNDTVNSSVSFDLSTQGQNIENLVLTGTGNIDGTGDAFNNKITGNSHNNNLDGKAALVNPWLSSDTLDGGGGSDNYTIHSIKDVIVADTSAVDRDQVYVDDATFTAPGTAINYTLATNLENLLFFHTGTARNVIGKGNAADNWIQGDSGNDSLAGLAGNDTLRGGDGNDTLDGYTGADDMDGGNGDDTYLWLNDGDVINDSGSGSDSDTLDIAFFPAVNTSSTTVFDLNSLGGGTLENINFLGTYGPGVGGYSFNTTSSHIEFRGNAADNIIQGTNLIDTFIGSAGDDIYYVTQGDRIYDEGINDGIDTVIVAKNTGIFRLNDFTVVNAPGHSTPYIENLILDQASTNAASLSGNDQDNLIEGAAGADSINGMGGNDTMVGGAGNDTYVIDSYNDQVYDSSGTSDTLSVTGGISHIDLMQDMAGGNLRWDGIENISLSVGDTHGNSTIWGSAGNNKITGDSFDNVMDGRAGADTMQGGFGNDTYYVDDVKDVISEDANMGSQDKVVISLPSANPTISAAYQLGWSDPSAAITAAKSYVLPAFAENLTLWFDSNQTRAGIGNINANIITGNIYDNYLYGGTGNDTIDGGIGNGSNGAGNDTLDGGVGEDVLIGGDGNDVYYVDMFGGVFDHVVEAAGSDSTNGSADQIIVRGNYDLNDVSYASQALGIEILQADSSAGATTIKGYNSIGTRLVANGKTSLFGGSGNDTYVLKTTTDQIVTNAETGGSADWVEEDFENFILDTTGLVTPLTGSSHIENLRLTGTKALNGTGVDGVNNQLIGNAGINILDGKGGADTMQGGDGNDIYYVDDAGDQVWEGPTGGTADLVYSSVDFDLRDSNRNTVQGDGGDYVENLTLIGNGNINGYGNGLNNVLIGNSGNNSLRGSGGNDSITGGSGNDYLFGGDDFNYFFGIHTGMGDNSGNDTLIGGDGDDVLDGGDGADSMDGGTGNDVYYVDNVGDKLGVETATGGMDWVVSTISYTLAANYERLSLIGSNATTGTGNTLNNTIEGSAGNNTLKGGGGFDTFVASAGDDTYYMDDHIVLQGGSTDQGNDTIIYTGPSATYKLDLTVSDFYNGSNAGIENATLVVGKDLDGNNLNNWLIGNAGANSLFGSAGNDTLDGGAGADTMTGGSGNDVFYVDNINDVVNEGTGQGTDEIRASISYTLASDPNNKEIENLTLTTAATALNATGNDGRNTVTGNQLNNVLQGGAGNDTINGGAGNDTLIGGFAADLKNINVTTLGDTDDLLQGGTGNDTYYVGNGGVMVYEGLNEGVDTVISGVDFDLRDSDQDGQQNSIGDNVDNLTLINGRVGHGNNLNNIIKGNTDNNTLIGEAGNDSLDGGDGNDSLDGGTGNDTLLGGNGNDTLNGGTGNDSMVGGVGDDEYHRDSAGDVIGAETNTVQDTANNNNSDHNIRLNTGDVVYTSVDYTLASGLEHLYAENRSEFDILSGAKLRLVGNTLNNHIVGDDGANYLDGGTGQDTLEGGEGNDTYVYDPADTIVEGISTDPYNLDVLIVNQTASLNVGDPGFLTFSDFVNFEGLELLATGTGAFNLTGNSGNNLLIGNKGNNVIDGGAGNDILGGGNGGNDMLKGLDGDDMYYLGSTMGNVTIQESTGNDWLIFKDYETDTLSTANLSIDLHNATFTIGTSHVTIQDSAGVTTAGLIENVHGGSGKDTLTGSDGDNILVGANGNDCLFGNGGNDDLDGGSGNDLMVGGAGNDNYFVDAAPSLTGGDMVVESAGGGTDTVYFLASRNYALYANVENFTLLDVAPGLTANNLFTSGNELNNVGIGNSGNNTLGGNAGNDLLFGLDGDDYLMGDDVFGSLSVNGDDTLDGGAGNDTLEGGYGNDTYAYHAIDPVSAPHGYGSDVIFDANGTDDLLDLSDFNFADATFTKRDLNSNGKYDDLQINLGTVNGNAQLINIHNFFNDQTSLGAGAGYIETLRFADHDVTTLDEVGGSSIGTGSMPPTPNDDTIYGADATRDSIHGLAGNDSLTGGNGNDSLYGDAGNDHLWGDNDNDLLDGGADNDILDGGNGNDSLIGGSGNDYLDGLDGNDTLDGGTGDDTMLGGAGNDTFIMSAGKGFDQFSDFDGPFSDNDPGDKVVFGTMQDGTTAITRADIGFTNNGNELWIGIAGDFSSTDETGILNEIVSPGSIDEVPIESFEITSGSDAGYYLDAAHLNQLISDITAYGQNTLGGVTFTAPDQVLNAMNNDSAFKDMIVNSWQHH